VSAFVNAILTLRHYRRSASCAVIGYDATMNMSVFRRSGRSVVARRSRGRI